MTPQWWSSSQVGKGLKKKKCSGQRTFSHLEGFVWRGSPTAWGGAEPLVRCTAETLPEDSEEQPPLPLPAGVLLSIFHESILTDYVCMWFSRGTEADRKVLQRIIISCPLPKEGPGHLEGQFRLGHSGYELLPSIQNAPGQHQIEKWLHK